MKKKIFKIVLFCFIIVMPFSVFFLVVESLPDQYEDTYVAELNDKFDLLCNTEGKKIIFVGGSSLPFGLRSDLIQSELPQYKVVNFGLYATLGTKLMMDLSKADISAGDIVVLSPEISEQTFSLYFNPKVFLQASDGFSSKYKYLSFDNKVDVFYNYYRYAFEKISLVKNKNKPNPTGIYSRGSFNSYGDIDVERSNNIMDNGVDVTSPIVPSVELLNDEFIEYVNGYCKFVREKNAKIYFNFSPCNQLAIGSSKRKRLEFQELLQLRIACDLLSNLEDCIMDYGYFYDTNFHLNSAGAVYYTNLLVRNLKMKLGLTDGNDSSFDVPDPPDLPSDEVVEPPPKEDLTPFEDYRGEPNNDYAEWFEYLLVGNSYRITGVKNEYKNITEVILPSTYNGKNITVLSEDALSGCVNLKKIHIGLTYKILERKAFSGCISLEYIFLYETDGNNIKPDATELLLGVARNVKISIPNGSNYSVGYTWSAYFDYFVYRESVK